MRATRWMGTGIIGAVGIVLSTAVRICAATNAPALPAHLMPRVMILVDEKSIGSVTASEVESITSELLLSNNLRVVDQKMVQANVAKDQRLLKMVGDPVGAAALGEQYGADVIITGEAVARPSPRRIADSNLRTYQAVVTLRAVRTDDASTLAMCTRDISVIGIDDVAGASKALTGAGRQSAEALIPQLVAAWEKISAAPEGKISHVTLTAGGVDQAWKLKALRDMLHTLGDKAQNVVQRSYTVGLAIFELDTPVKVEELAEAMVLKPPQGMKLQVVETSAGKIEVRAAPAQ